MNRHISPILSASIGTINKISFPPINEVNPTPYCTEFIYISDLFPLPVHLLKANLLKSIIN